MEAKFDNGLVQLYQADARSIPLADQSVHCVVTSPPYYGLRVYKDNGDRGIGLESSVETYIANMVEVFQEVRRVLRDDGVVWINMGDSYAGSGKGQNADGSHAAKHGEKQHTSKGTLTGGLPTDRELASGNRLGIPERVVLALQADGWIWRDTIIWAKKSAMPESLAGWRWERCQKRTWLYEEKTEELRRDRQNGRDFGTPEITPCPGCPKCQDNDGLVLRKGSWRCTSSYELIFMLTKKMAYYSDGESVKVKNGIAAVVQSPDLMGESNHFVNDLWRQAPSVIGTEPPSGVAHTSLPGVAILAARAVFDIVQFDEDFSLLPLDSEKWQQLRRHFGGFASGDTPTIKRLAHISLGFLHGQTSAKQFVGKVHSLGLNLAQMNLFSEGGTNSLPLSLTAVNADGETSISIEGTGDVGQFNLSIHNNNYTPATPTSLANRRSVWNDISPEPYGGSHFATFPSDLPRLCIQASTSERGVCSECGSQWARVIDKPKIGSWHDHEENLTQGGRQNGAGPATEYETAKTTGWRPTCGCKQYPIPSLVLDCFSGTGTTALAAMRLNRRCVGIDLSEEYIKQAVIRLGNQTLPMPMGGGAP